MPPREFICRFPGCNASYRRKEHLGRHKAQHTAQRQSFSCSICGRSFGRNDTLRRHRRRAHHEADDEPVLHASRACANCRRMKSRCEGGLPCRECLRRKISCFLNEQDEVKRGADRPPPRSLSSHEVSPCPETGRPQKERFYLDLYFKSFHPYWPFVHRASFNHPSETPLLVQSMTVIGLWTSEEQSAQSAAIDLHNVLDSAIRQQREVWDASAAEEACSACSWPIPMYQAILLHTCFGLLYKGGASLGLDLKPSPPPAVTELLDFLVGSCKRLGMFYYPNMLARYREDDLASYVWVSIEEVKRFNLALYKVCGMLSRSRDQSSNVDGGVTGAASRGLTASDLQFPMPKNDALWNAVNKEEWDTATAEGANRHSLDDPMEEEWISNSAALVELMGV